MSYLEHIEKIKKYVQLVGMFESKNQYFYEPYNDINQNIFDWKDYNVTNDNSTYYQNGHDLVEMKFNLSDVTLMGTENHINKMPEVINRLQVRLNEKQLKIDSY